MAIGVVAVMTALGTNIHLGTFNRTQSKVNSVLLDASEYVRSGAGQPAGQPAFVPCGAAAVPVPPAAVSAPASYSITQGPPVDAGNAPGSTIPGTCAGGLERITVTVTGDGLTLTHDVVIVCDGKLDAGTCT